MIRAVMTPAFVCPKCGAKSYNPNDARERYCVRCHVFVDDEVLETEKQLEESKE